MKNESAKTAATLTDDSPSAVLKRSTLFSTLTDHQLARIGSLVREADFAAGSVIFRRDEAGDALYLVASGHVRVFNTNEEGAEVELARLGPGESFGEMALLTGEPRSATVAAAEPLRVLVLHKDEFDRVLEEAPVLARHFVNLLGRRLRQGNTEAEKQSSREQALRELAADNRKRDAAQLLGKSRPAKELIDQAGKAAATDTPLIISGQPGTEKEMVAQWVHEHGARSSEVFLSVDCATIPQLAPAAPGQAPAAPGQAADSPFGELSQESAIFGHRRGVFSFAKVNRLGYLEVARGGTLFLNNVDRLGPGVQAKLAGFLKLGHFRPMGGPHDIPPNVRLVLGCDDPERAVQKGQLDPQLWAAMAVHRIPIPPLRDRERDLPLWVAFFIARANRVAGKDVRGISPEAMAVIYGYKWPRNMEELEEVVRRGVYLADGPQLAAENVFVGLGDVQGGGFNLLRVPEVRRFMEHPAFPGAIQIATVAFLAVMLFLAFWGPRYSTQNVALVMAWGLMWPALVLSILFGARFFCSTCTFGAISAFIQRRVTLKRKVPGVIKKFGLYSAALGFPLLIWIEHVTGSASSSLVTALIVVSMMSLAVTAGVIFERAAWCRYLCPLGRMVGVFSTVSPVALRSNAHVCSSGCTTHNCYTGNKTTPGCPFYQGAFSVQSNEFCKLCGHCVKTCPNRSVQLYLRLPGQELWKTAKYTFEVAFFIPLIAGSVLAAASTHMPAYQQFEAMIGAEKLSFALALAGASAGVWALIYLIALVWRRGTSDSVVQTIPRVAYSVIPLALGGVLGQQLSVMLTSLGMFVPVLGNQLGGFDWSALGWQASPGFVKFVEVVLVLLGAWASLYVGRRIAERQGGPGGRVLRLSRYTLVTALVAAYLTVFLVTK